MPETRPETCLAVLRDLPYTVRAERANRGLSLREASVQIGMPYADLNRFENGVKGNQRLETVTKLLEWLVGGDGRG
jgi:transcriptional regulator with XRE-family HTH domain